MKKKYLLIYLLIVIIMTSLGLEIEFGIISYLITLFCVRKIIESSNFDQVCEVIVSKHRLLIKYCKICMKWTLSKQKYVP